jgi:hypothetical protein
MLRIRATVIKVLAVAALGAACSRPAPDAECPIRFISFNDVKPPGFALGHFWDGIGRDSTGRVYVAISAGEERDSGVRDVLLFEYDPRSDRRRFLNSVREILSNADNLGPNEHWPRVESVAKVHSAILEHDGRLYFSTHDWYRFDGLDNHRGGHFLSYDPTGGSFSNPSRSDPGGVAVAGEGIIALGVLRDRNELVGWTFPYGNVLLHDLTNGRTIEYASGLPREPRPDVSRVVIATRTGEVYAAYQRDPDVPESDRLFRLDRQKGRLVPTSQRFGEDRRLEALQETENGDTFYLAGLRGSLHAFDVVNERLSWLGSVLPAEREARGESVRELYNLALSPNERLLFSIPTRTSDGNGAHRVYEYDLVTGARTEIGDCRSLLAGSTPTGSAVFDRRGRYYLSVFWEESGRSGLLQVDVSHRLGLSGHETAE